MTVRCGSGWGSTKYHVPLEWRRSRRPAEVISKFGYNLGGRDAGPWVSCFGYLDFEDFEIRGLRLG